MELLERANFLGSLADYANEARNGHGRFVLVAGDSGIGKTALLEAFQQWSGATRWLWGACDALFTPRPLGPLFDIAAELGGELFALCRREAPREELFRVFLEQIDGGAHPTVVAVEDIHWADEATLDLLRFTARRLSRNRTLLIATYRDDEVQGNRALELVLGDLARQRAVRRMLLPSLSPAAVQTLAAGRPVDPTELHRLTGGNPFYVSEILDAGPDAVPTSVRDAVMARMSRLRPEARRVVEAGALVGGRIDPAILETVAEDEGTGLDHAVASGMLVSESGGLRFRHELARMAVEGSIPNHRAVELHRRILQVLEASAPLDHAVLAHHAEGARDPAAVLRHAPEAGRRSAELGSHREAAAQYERALRFAGGIDAADLAHLHEGLAYELSLVDRWEEATEERQEALRLWRQVGNAEKIGENLRWLSRCLWRLCRGAEANEAAAAALQILEPLPPAPELAWAYANLALQRVQAGDVRDGIRLAEQARDLAESLAQPEILSHALNTMACAYGAIGEGGWDLFERALRIALDEGLEEQVGRAYANMYATGTKQRRFGDVESSFAEGLAFCEDHDVATFTVCLTGWRAVALTDLGRWDEAATLGEGMLGLPEMSFVNRMNPLLALGATGRPDQVAGRHRRAGRRRAKAVGPD